MSSKDGFSVVAPTSTIVPSSMTGRNESCWARLKRWISSTNSSVPCPTSRRERAASNTFFRSATPEKIAEICSNCSSVASARSRATVVLPVPGGPQKMSEPSVRVSSIRVSTPSGPSKWSWPTTSSRRPGRSLSASGRGAARSSPAAVNRLAPRDFGREVIGLIFLRHQQLIAANLPAEHDRHLLAVAGYADAPQRAWCFRRLRSRSLVCAILVPLTFNTISPR